jgi:hypothetical protein
LPECNSSKMMPKGMMQAKKKASSSWTRKEDLHQQFGLILHSLQEPTIVLLIWICIPSGSLLMKQGSVDVQCMVSAVFVIFAIPMLWIG